MNSVISLDKKKSFAIGIFLLLLSSFSYAQNWLDISAGTTQYVGVGDLDVSGNLITIEALVTRTAAGTNVVSKHTTPGDANYLLRMASFEFTTSSGFFSLPSNYTYNDNEVYHIAAVYDGTEAHYYVNGCLVNSISASGTLFQNDLNTGIGAQEGCACELYTGYIDEVRIWNVARTQAQLETNMNTPLLSPGTQPGLLGYYQFEGDFTNAQGNAAYDGTPAGGATTAVNPYASIPLIDPLLVNATDIDLVCYGDNSGSITATASGGNSLYEYSIDGTTYQSSGNFTGLSAGTYTVYASWNNSCTSTTTVDLTEPDSLIIDVIDTSDVSCSGTNDGQIIIDAQGGVPDYTYNWSNGDTDNSNTGLGSGAYTVTVTDQSACTVTQSYTISGSFPLSVNIANYNDVTCNGGSDGSIDAEGIGGDGQYSFAWTGGLNGATVTNLIAGTYTVTVTDGLACSATNEVTLVEPGPFTADIGVISNVSCNGGSDARATANANGGAPNYIYQWSNGELTNGASALAAGMPSVTVTDANGCTATATTTITEPDLLVSEITDTTDALCYGTASGSATVTPQGGTPGYGFLWTNNDVTATSSNLLSGSYSVTVTDANGCTATSDVVIEEPDTLVASPTGIVNVSCNGGSDGEASAFASGGKQPYSYSWPGNIATQTITNLSAGTYTVTITDANGCMALAEALVNEPAVLTVNIINVSQISCYGEADGQATASATGGVFPYTYAWSNGGTANIEGALDVGTNNVTVTDSKGCSATASVSITEPTQVTVTANADVVICLGTSASLTASAGGGNGPYTYHWNNGFVGQPVTVSPNNTVIYWVFAKDASGCNSPPDSINIYVLPILSATTTPDMEICKGDSAVIGVTAGGGNSNYSYAWSSGETGAGPYIIYPDSTSVYTVTVSDNCGSPEAIRDINVIVNPLPEVDFVGDSLMGCVPHTVNFENNTTIEEGGIADWYWEFGDGETTGFIAPAYIYDLDSTYTVKLTATSNKGCVDSLVRVDYITTYPVPTADFNIDESILSIIYANAKFEDLSTGATIWNWSFGDSTFSSLQSPDHLYEDTGTYVINQYVENAYGCWDEASDRVVVLPLFKIYIPNTFTPDADELNDEFKPIGVGFDEYEMEIYDRWGNLIFEDQGENIAWDGLRSGGVEAEQAVYVYYIYFRDISGKQRRYRGMVTLIR